MDSEVQQLPGCLGRRIRAYREERPLADEYKHLERVANNMGSLVLKEKNSYIVACSIAPCKVRGILQIMPGKRTMTTTTCLWKECLQNPPLPEDPA